ncbi:MAG: Ldh family oxidoreductase [Woeseiaceae bacterium]
MDTINLSLTDIELLASDCLQRHGADQDNAAAVARIITAAERDGCHSHGLMRLAGYLAALDSGKVNGHAKPEVKQIAPAVVQVDGDGGFAPLALEVGRPAFIECTKNNGIAALSLVNIHHFAALWTEVEPVVSAGLCAMACVSYKPAVIPAGGSKALYGTNPVAFGWPRTSAPPVIFDQASSVMARGEVMLAARNDEVLPPGVGVDSDGNPTEDPNEVLKGAMLAYGGHKGSSIAMMVELLAGALIGESLSFEAAERDNNDGGPPQGGEFMLALDPNHFGDAEGWSDHAEGLFAKIVEQDGARLPSDRRYKHRAVAAEQGVDVAKSVHDKILSM